MAWNSFLKNLIGGETSTDVLENDHAPNDGVARNENLPGRAFKKQLEDAEKAILLDVRTAGEFSGGTIPGSKNIDFLSPSFGKKVEQLDKDATYFVFCRSGNRSGQACKMMHKMGFDVRNLSGGIGDFPA